MKKIIKKISVLLILFNAMLFASNPSMSSIINYLLSSKKSTFSFVSDRNITLVETDTMSFYIDANAEGTAIYSIRGGDSNLFIIDTHSGLISFKIPPIVEENISYTFQAIATDSQGNQATQDINLYLKTDESINSLEKDINSSQSLDKEWYIRIVVEDIYNHLKTASTQLGQVDSLHSIEKFNLKALNPFGSSYIDVVFRNPLGMDLGDYKSNFHNKSTKEDTWEFTVKSHDSNASMVLGWRGLYLLSPYIDKEDRQRYTQTRMPSHPLLHSMVLIDVLENKEITILEEGEKQEYLFYMNGSTEKVFQWKLKEPSMLKSVQKRSLHTSKQKLDKLQIKALRMDAKMHRNTNKENKVFSPTQKPPHFEVLVK